MNVETTTRFGRRTAVRGALAGAALLLAASAAWAAEPPDRAERRETVFSLAVKGGWLMIPIGVASVVVLTWTIERLVSLRGSRVFSPGLLDRVFDALPARGQAVREDIAKAARLCDEEGTLVARVVRTGIEKIHRDETHAQAFLEESVAKEVHLLRRSLRVFEICASVAPLLGLLGTVFGMISCFERAAVADTASRADTLASGIYMALVTTAAGLCVAIPALLVHHYFLGRTDRIQDALEEAATEFLDRYYGSPAAIRLRRDLARAPSVPGDRTESVGSGREVGS